MTKASTIVPTYSVEELKLQNSLIEDYQQEVESEEEGMLDPTTEEFYFNREAGCTDDAFTRTLPESNYFNQENASSPVRKGGIVEEDVNLTAVLMAKKIGRAWRTQNVRSVQYGTYDKEDVRFRKRKKKDIEGLQATMTAGLKPGFDENRRSTVAPRLSVAPKTLGKSFKKASNRETMKDSTNKEVEERLHSSWAVLLLEPLSFESKWKYCWDVFMGLITIFLLTQVPLTLAFGSAVSFPNIDSFIDVSLFVDILLSFRITYLDHQNLEVFSTVLIRKRYLSTYFPMDFLAAFPFDRLIALQDPMYQPFLRANRVVRVGHVLKQFNKNTSGAASRIVKLLMLFILVAHIFACSFLAIGKLQHEASQGGRWIDQWAINEYAMEEQYLISLYWSFTTLGTVGYGDITATSIVERIFACIVMLMGSVIYATIFGTLTTLITNFDKNHNRYNAKISIINEFCALNNLPNFIRNRLRAYVDATWAVRKGLSVDEVMDGVPAIVKSELLMYMYADLMREVPMFSLCDRRFLEKVVVNFRHQVFLMGDFMIREGDVGEKLFFILSGHCDICKYKSEENGDEQEVRLQDLYTKSIFIAQRGPGSFVGEGALLQGRRRVASVICSSSIVQSLYLLKDDFDEVAKEHPEARRALEQGSKNALARRFLNSEKKRQTRNSNRSGVFSKMQGNNSSRSFNSQMLNALNKDIRHHGGIKLQPGTSSKTLSESASSQDVNMSTSLDEERSKDQSSMKEVINCIQNLQKVLSMKSHSKFSDRSLLANEVIRENESSDETLKEVKLAELEEKMKKLQATLDRQTVILEKLAAS